MNKDDEIGMEVLKVIKAERKIRNPDKIEVSVKDGVVTLGGSVEHYMDRIAALAAVECIAGVEGIVDEIEVELPLASKREDLEIAGSACSAIEHNSVIPRDQVKVVVCDGQVTLEGEVREQYQKVEAENTVSRVLGVKGVTNNISVKPQVKPWDVIMEIERIYQHMAMHHARNIHVEIKDGKVILSGTVRAWIEKSGAEEAAYEVPGVKEVENRLEITPLLEGKEEPPGTTEKKVAATSKQRST